MKYLLCSALFLLLSSCTTTSTKAPAACVNWTARNLVHASQLSAEQSMQATTPKEKILYSKKGLDWAEKCVASFPREAGCYFYRAVNRGLYIETTMLKYQKGLKKMIEDCHRVIELDKSYDQGGAYRILGNIYLKAPAFTLSKKSIRKDIEKAEEFAKEAIEIDDHELENRLLWAEVLFEKEEYEQARDILQKVVVDLQKQKANRTRNQKNLKIARRLLAKAEKRLTK